MGMGWQRFERTLMHLFAIAALAPLIAGCSAWEKVSVLPKFNGLDDRLTFSGAKPDMTLGPVTAQDLVGSDGACASPGQGGSPIGASAADAGWASATLIEGGIGLQMTECDVVRRAGAPDRVEIGTSDRGERSVVLTFIRGPRPGIYRFAGGRLYSVEAPPESPTTSKPTTPKKRATKTSAHT
jgi:hypothetical protein